MGFYADRILRRFGSIAPWVLILNLVACVAFIVIPLAASGGAMLLVIVISIWIVSSAVLRAPLYGLMAKANKASEAYAPLLAGLGLASAAAPYLGKWLKGVEAALPFLVAGLALALAVTVFSRYTLPVLPVARPRGTPPRITPILGLLLATLAMAGGFQLHLFLNAPPLFKAVTDASLLPLLTPVFWVGYTLAVHPGVALRKQFGSRRLLLGGALLAVLAQAALWLDLPLLPLAAAHTLAGTAWGGISVATLYLLGKAGQPGREAGFMGLLFATLALAAAVRTGLGWDDSATLSLTQSMVVSGVLWVSGGLLAALWVWRNRT